MPLPPKHRSSEPVLIHSCLFYVHNRLQSLSLFRTYFVSLSLSLFHTNTHTLFLSFSLSVFLSLLYTLSLFLCYTLSLILLSLIPILSLSLSCTLSCTLYLTYALRQKLALFFNQSDFKLFRYHLSRSVTPNTGSLSLSRPIPQCEKVPRPFNLLESELYPPKLRRPSSLYDVNFFKVCYLGPRPVLIIK